MTYQNLETDERFKNFQNEIINLTKQQYSENRGTGLQEPIVFIAIEADYTDPKKYWNKMPQVKKQYDMLCEKIKEHGDTPPSETKFLSSHLTIVGMPLGPFFNDDEPFKGDDKKNYDFLQFKKAEGRKCISKMVEKMEEEHGNVKYSAFISEAWMTSMKKEDLPKEAQNNRKNATEHISKLMEEALGVKNMPERKEKVIITFEKRMASQTVMFDLLLNEESKFCELINEERLPSSSEPNGGTFSGIIHKENTGFGIN